MLSVHPEVQRDQKPELCGAGEGDASRTTRTSWDLASGGTDVGFAQWLAVRNGASSAPSGS